MVFTSHVAAPKELYGNRVFRAVALGRNLFFVIALLGVVALPVSRTLSASLFLAGLTGAIAMHLVAGIAGYRRTMRAEWPKVAPVADDDWD